MQILSTIPVIALTGIISLTSSCGIFKADESRHARKGQVHSKTNSHSVHEKTSYSQPRGQRERDEKTDFERITDSPLEERGVVTRTESRETYERKLQKPVATDQSNMSSDLSLLKDVRQSIIDNDSLSTTGKNVQVLTERGKVTLQGAVEDRREKNELESTVKKVKGVKKLVSHLTIEE